MIGAAGFLGRAFLEAYRRAHPGTIGTCAGGGAGAGPAGPGVARADLPRRLADTGHREALILAGVASIVRCERDPAGTRAVNVEGTLRLAEALLAAGVRPVFASSDYVFDGVARRLPRGGRPGARAPSTGGRRPRPRRG